MRSECNRLLLALTALAAVPACATPEQSPAPRVGVEDPNAVLQRDGSLLFAGVAWDTRDPVQRSEVQALLVRWYSGRSTDNEPRLRIASQRGTPYAEIEHLMEVLEEAGIEDYRLDLNVVQ